MTEQEPLFPWKERYDWMSMILAAPDLKPITKVVGIRVVMYLNAWTMQCNPSVATIAKGVNLAPRTVRDHLILLREGDYLDYSKNPGGHHHETNNYEPTWPITPRVRNGAGVNGDGCAAAQSTPAQPRIGPLRSGAAKYVEE